jgi:hypothetical protein
MAAMTQQLEMRADAPPPVNWDRAVQELIMLLAEAVLTLPDSEKRCVLDKAITPLFEAVLAPNKAKKVPGVGLIWLTLLATGHRDFATQLWPPRAALSNQTAGVALSSSAAASRLEERKDVA